MAGACPKAREVPAPSSARKVGKRSPGGGEVHTEVGGVRGMGG